MNKGFRGVFVSKVSSVGRSMKNARALVGTGVAAALTLPAMVAHAALDAGVTDGITAAQTDGVSLIGKLAAAGAAVYIIHKILKKFGVSL